MEEKKNPENKFEVEMMRRMELVILKLNGLETDVSGIKQEVSDIKQGVSGIKQEVSGIKQEVSKNSQKLDILSSQFNDVAVMAIKDNQRITKLEEKVEDLQSNIH